MMKTNRNADFTLKGSTRLLVRTGNMNTISFYTTVKQIRNGTGNCLTFNGAMRKALWKLETTEMYDGICGAFDSCSMVYDISLSIV